MHNVVHKSHILYVLRFIDLTFKYLQGVTSTNKFMLVYLQDGFQIQVNS